MRSYSVRVTRLIKQEVLLLVHARTNEEAEDLGMARSKSSPEHHWGRRVVTGWADAAFVE